MFAYLCCLSQIMQRIVRFVFVTALLLVSYFSFNNTSGPGGGYSNAPSESNCTNCHSGSLVTSGTNWQNIRLSGNFVGGGYIPDSVYRITLTHRHSGISKFGFQVTSLTGANLPAGELRTGGSGRVQVRTRTFSGRTRYYIEHTTSGTSAVGTDSTAWTFEWKAPSTNTGDVTFYAVVNAANGNSGTSGDIILAKTFVIRPSDSLPVAKVNADTNTVCQKGAVKFSAGGSSNPTSYAWSFPGGSPSSSTQATPQITYSSPGSYFAILSITNKFGVSKPDTLRINVKPSPNAFITGSSDRIKCQESLETLNADFIPGATYLWSNGARTSSISTRDTGVFKVEVTEDGCSNVSDEVRIRNYPRNPLSLSSNLMNDSICQGGKLILSADKGFKQYRFYDSARLIATQDSAVLHLSAEKAARYRVEATDNNQCLSDTSNALFVWISPQIDTPRIQCVNRDAFSIEFEWTVFEHYDSFQVSIDSGKTWITPSAGARGLSHVASGLYPDQDYEFWVRGVSNGICAFSPVGKTVCRTGQCNSLNVSVQADTSVCKGNTIRVEVNGLAGKSYSIAFEQLGFFTDTIFRFTPQISKNFVLEVYDSSALGCPPTRRFFSVHVDEIPEILLEPNGRAVQFCAGEPINFKATAGAENYAYFRNGILQQQTAENEWTVNNLSNNDSVWVIARKGACLDTTEVVTLLILPKPNARFTYTTTGNVYQFSPEQKGLKTWAWDFGLGLTSSIEEPVQDFTSRVGTRFMVRLAVSDFANCEGNYEEEIVLGDINSISAVSELPSVQIYPNPSAGVLNIEWNSAAQGTYKIFDLSGRALMDGKLDPGVQALNVQSLMPGYYIIKIRDDHQREQYLRWIRK